MKNKIVGWIVRGADFKYRRSLYGMGDSYTIRINRGNPNPNNRTKTNHWKKVSIIIEDI